MRYDKLIYIASAICVMFGGLLAIAPNLVDFLNTHNEKTLNYFLSFTIAYVGIAATALVKIRNKRRSRIEKRKKVFLIYSRADIEKVSKVAAELQQQGFDIWFNENDLLPGQIVQKEIQSALRDSVAAIVFFSRSPLSPFAQSEMDYLMKRRSVNDDRFVPILPVVIEEVELPELLKGVIYVRYDDESAIEKLSRSLHILLKK